MARPKNSTNTTELNDVKISEPTALKDGDVIHDIDGREPKDVRHALRILGSYAAGEKLKLGVRRAGGVERRARPAHGTSM